MMKKSPQSRSIQLRFEQRLFDELEKRDKHASLPTVIRRDLDRYYYLLQYALAGLNLTEDGANLLCDVLNSTTTEASLIRLLWAEIEDAIRIDHLDDKWNLDGREFVNKLKNMCTIELAAIIDAVERYWMHSEQSNNTLIAVGLVKNNN